MPTLEEQIKALCDRATALRQEARQTEQWKLNIEALLESNNDLFQGPISWKDMEACYEFVLDNYDPNNWIKIGALKPEDYPVYVKQVQERDFYNPFYELLELDEQGNVADVVLYTTDDCELVGEFLSKKYKWKEDQ